MSAVKAKKGTTTKKSARDLFGEAFKALGQHKYDKADTVFEKIIAGFPDEEDVLAIARTFQRTCQNALEKKSAKTTKRSAEEDFDMGVFHHNNHDYAEANAYFQKALKSAGSDADYIYYAWAATKVQQGDLDEGLAELKKAAEIDSANLCYAINDPDFEPMEEHEGFRALLGMAD